MIALAVLCSSPLAHADQTQTRQTMQRVLASLETLLPPVLDGTFEAQEAEPAEVREAIEQLSRSATDLAAHAPESNAAFAFLSRSLARDARAVERRVERGRYADAAYRVVRMTETCVACHSRLPSDAEASMGASLTRKLDVEGTPPLRLARFDVALRQFDRALDRYEAAISDPESLPAQLDYSGALADYLIVALRVRSAAERAKVALAQLSGRDDLTAQLRKNLPVWIEALGTRAGALQSKPSVAAARQLLEAGEALRSGPSDRGDLVHRVLASALLYRLVEEAAASPREQAEALLLLAETDAFVRRSFERSEAEFYLERAIRLVPGTDLAREAYVRLEDQVLLGYTGSSGTNVPLDVQRTLDQLRELSVEAPEPVRDGT